MTKKEKKVPFDPKVFLATVNGGRSISKYRKNETVFSQSSSADAVFLYPKRQGQNHRCLRAGQGDVRERPFDFFDLL
jgi:hypothetical protein